MSGREPKIGARGRGLGWAVAFAVAVALALVLAAVVALRTRERPERPPSGFAARPPAAVTLPAGDPLVELHDGELRISLGRDRRLAGPPGLPADLGAAVSAALADGRLARPEGQAALAGRRIALAGPEEAAGETFSPLAPVATAVADGKPKFRWRILPGARNYEVAVFDRDFTRVAASGPIAAPVWSPSTQLPSGIYTWQVTAQRGGESLAAPGAPEPEARFRVLDPAERATLAAELAAAGISHLARGVAYARAGVLDAAEAELSTLAAANPGSEPVAHLLAELATWRRPEG